MKLRKQDGGEGPKEQNNRYGLAGDYHDYEVAKCEAMSVSKQRGLPFLYYPHHPLGGAAPLGERRKDMSTREKCEKYFWMEGASVVTRCPQCDFHFTVGVGYQFEGKRLVPVKCPRCRNRLAMPVLKDKKTLAC